MPVLCVCEWKPGRLGQVRDAENAPPSPSTSAPHTIDEQWRIETSADVIKGLIF